MSDDIIKRLREALAAGPTVGPWTMLPAGAGEQCVARINSWEAVPPNGVELAHDSIDANYIAAASPDNIAALLDRLDDLETIGAQAVRWAPSSAHWSNELRRLFGTNAREGIECLEARLRDATSRLEAAERENERLREDAERYRFIRDNPWPVVLSGVIQMQQNSKWDASIDAARREK